MPLPRVLEQSIDQEKRCIYARKIPPPGFQRLSVDTQRLGSGANQGCETSDDVPKWSLGREFQTAFLS
jgi:hypothetical protein